MCLHGAAGRATGGMNAQGARLQGTRRTKALQGSTSSDRWRPTLLRRYCCLLKRHFTSPHVIGCGPAQRHDGHTVS